ncbi:hypothetical protein [Xylanimonas cellulosilytica]|uniref:hypothetical protein n=1 Tax=Xylanimonas cellulosilytica TaxID=186189 RepID=UPI0002ED0EE6|nr:hypothetical protein [Xylanimonas cellulosilytica]
MATKDWVKEKDLEWREGLRRVSLIAELEIDDAEIERAERVLGLLLEKNAAWRVAKAYPAFMAVSLVTAGMRSWEDGTFYQKVADHIDVGKQSVEDAAREFPTCLTKFGLPRFGNAGGMSWVTPILLHGAVPLDHLDELLELLTKRRRRDPSLTGESFVEWVRLSPAQIADQPKALVRFLEHGGDFAPDFAGRVIDLVDGRDVALPRRVVERMREYIAESPSRYRQSGPREARPTIMRAADGALHLLLPSVRPSNGREVSWRVTIGDRVSDHVADVPWGSNRGLTEGVTVDLDAPVRSIHVERETGATDIAFVRKEDPLLVFDPEGQLVMPTQVIPSGPVVLMWPDTSDGSPKDDAGRDIAGAERVAPYGWERWKVLRADTRDTKYVRLGNGPRRLVAGADRPWVVMPEPVAHVATLDDRDVLPSLPTVELPANSDPAMWRVLLTTTDGRAVQTLDPTAHHVTLLADRAAPIDGNFVLEVRGPLGRGTRRTFAVVEGLDVVTNPGFRTLAAEGGLVPADVVVRSNVRTTDTLKLAREERSLVVEFPHLAVKITPPHLAYRATGPSTDTPWATSPIAVPAREVRETTFQVTGWRRPQRPQLVLKAGGISQFVPAAEFRGGQATFNLTAFSGAVAQAGTGTLFLDTEPPAKVLQFRPSSLASSLVRAGERLLVEPAVHVPLEVVLHRAWAPWTPAVVCPVIDDQVVIPDALRHAGNLRVLVRELDEWGVQPVGALPPSGRTDVFDLEGEWNPAIDEPETRSLVRALGELDGAGDEKTTTVTAARVFELMRHGADGQQSSTIRRRLLRHLTADPSTGLHGVLETSAGTADITWALVESGLVWTPVNSFDRGLSIERLGVRSPLAAVIAASNRIRWGNPGAEAVLAEIVGHGVVELATGGNDGFGEGRFEDWYLASPELVEYGYKLLNPVPALPVDPDTRIAAAFDLWHARGQLTDAVRHAMPTINVARQVMVAENAQGLWPMVQARLSQDGPLALPALSMALAIVARLAAHGHETARKMIANDRSVYPLLARRAPRIVEIDVIRADAAVRSLLK